MFIIMAILSLTTVCQPVPEVTSEVLSVLKDTQIKKTFITKDGKEITYKKVPTNWVKTTKKSI